MDKEIWDDKWRDGPPGKDVTHGSSSWAGERCFHGHPALKLGATGLQIWGGSCSFPSVKDADVYIGFDGGMRLTERHYPWTDGAEVLFRITDGSAPSEAAQFRKLVDWTLAQLQAGKKVHCGCVGGHGRTGTFLAALTCVAAGEPDAIAYVREHYCKKAVETKSQIDFLVKNFGIKPVEHASKHNSGALLLDYAPTTPSAKKAGKALDSTEGRYTPMADNFSIWGKA